MWKIKQAEICAGEVWFCLFVFPQHIAVSASTEIDIANLVKQVKS